MIINQYGQTVGDPLPEWQPAKRPGDEILNGRLCRLEPLNPQRDYVELFEAFQQMTDGRDWTYLFTERPESPQAMLQNLRDMQDNPALVNFTVFDLSTGLAVGSVAYMRIDEANGVLEIGHVRWSPAMKRHSTATEAISLMLHYAFDRLGYRRCEWKCDSHNTPSKQAALRFGFLYEGTFKYAVITKGRTRDTDWFAITGDRWPSVASAFAQWLSKDNFDSAGQQIKRLQAFMR